MKREWLDTALDITGSFEGSGYDALAGNFDGMGISAGILQFNFGKNTLQLLLGRYQERFGDISENIIFPEPIDHLAFLSPKEAVAFAKNYMLDGKRIKPEWVTPWKHFLRLPGCKDVQKDIAENIYGKKAYALMDVWRLHSLRAFCFFFDVAVQNGSMKGIKRADIDLSLDEYWSVMSQADDSLIREWTNIVPTEEQMLLFIAGWERSRKSIKRWQDDVFSRKSCIAMGRGLVHGQVFDFQTLFDES